MCLYVFRCKSNKQKERDYLMDDSRTISLLASFATLKSLSDAKKYESPYQILAEFVRYIISIESIRTYQACEMKNLLNDFFGFSIPESVIRTTSRKMSEITVKDGYYTISEIGKGTDPLFNTKIKEAGNTSADFISSLTEYISEQTGLIVQENEITQELIGFLVDDQSGKYTDLIGKFILKNEKDEKIQSELSQLKSGSILYIGLNHNIGETGGIAKHLTLFLGTEILFSLIGYNGKIFKQLADDFYSLVSEANRKEKKITLKFFFDTKKEIDEFFYAAEEVVEGKSHQLSVRPAMADITRGCQTASDVAIKRSDFYTELRNRYDITEDTNDTYYADSSFEYNFESFENLKGVDEDEKEKKEKSAKLVSNINKLRKGKCFSNDIDAEYLIVTNSKMTLLYSQEMTTSKKVESKSEYISNYAVSLDKITSLLWYKLGNGFGKRSYPSNVNAVLRARIVLSASIAKKADLAYSDIKKQYEEGIITEDQLAARIITLRGKPSLPEELQGDDIDETMNFSSEFLMRYEEMVKENQKTLGEKDEIIDVIKKESENKDRTILSQNDIIASQQEELARKDSVIAEKEKSLAKKEQELSKAGAELKKYIDREQHEKERRYYRKTIFAFGIRNIIYLAVMVCVLALLFLICKLCFHDSGTAISIAIGVLGILIAYISKVISDFRKTFNGKKKK